MSRPTDIMRLALSLGVAAIVAMALPMHASANGDDRPYGPITGGDFGASPPPVKDRPKDNDGNPVKAEISAGLAVEKNVNSTFVTNADGSITVKTTADPKASSVMDRGQSWIDPDVKDNPGVLDHEQGHFDVAEKHARELQAEYNTRKQSGGFTETKQLPRGSTQQDVDREIDRQTESLNKKIDDKLNERHASNEAENKQYDKETNHSQKPAEQEAARKAQRQKLEAPNENEERKEGAEAKSRTSESIHFDALTLRLTINNNFIVGIDPLGSGLSFDPDDPIFGAEIRMPEYKLEGILSKDTYFFSSVDEGPKLAVLGKDALLFSTDLPYLLYDPKLNLFYGLGGRFEAAVGLSFFVDQMVGHLAGSGPSLFGFEFTPDLDFFAATSGFTVSASSAGSNGDGARSLIPKAVPEPSTLLMTLSAVALLGCRWLRRKRARTTATAA